MKKTTIQLTDLDIEARLLVQKLSLRCCEDGEAPLFTFGRSVGKDEVEFNALMMKLIKTGGDLGFHPAFDKPEHAAALTIIQNQVRENHLNLLIDQDLNLKTIEERSPKLTSLVITDGDDVGLVEVKNMKSGRQWFEHEGKTLYISPAIPGSLNSCWPLSGLFCMSERDPTLKIRPDAFRITPLENARARIELSRAYGKPFNLAWLRSLRGTAIAQHEPDPSNYLIRGHRTQFIWERLDNDEIQFSCEELPDEASYCVTTRFLHGIFDIKKDGFTHFDGAVHIYSGEDYQERINLNLGAHYMKYKKAKIFRLDSLISFNKAELLLSNFYRWNDLVPEYFSHHNSN